MFRERPTNMSSNYCVSCGDEIPEGRFVCPNCEKIGKAMDDMSRTFKPNTRLLCKVGKVRGTSRYAVYTGGNHSIVMQVCKTKKQAITLAAAQSGLTTKEYLKLMKGNEDDA